LIDRCERRRFLRSWIDVVIKKREKKKRNRVVFSRPTTQRRSEIRRGKKEKTKKLPSFLSLLPSRRATTAPTAEGGGGTEDPVAAAGEVRSPFAPHPPRSPALDPPPRRGERGSLPQRARSEAAGARAPPEGVGSLRGTPLPAAASGRGLVSAPSPRRRGLVDFACGRGIEFAVASRLGIPPQVGRGAAAVPRVLRGQLIGSQTSSPVSADGEGGRGAAAGPAAATVPSRMEALHF
jgi:hypothetical protein